MKYTSRSHMIKVLWPIWRFMPSDKSFIYKTEAGMSSGIKRHMGHNTLLTRQSEMADLARRATRWVGTFPYILTPIPNLYDHSFPRYGQITFLTFRRPTTLTFDLKFWKYLSVTVYPYVICMPSFIMIGWEMAEILHFEILRKHGQTHKQTHTHKQTDMGITIPRPPPMGGEVISQMFEMGVKLTELLLWTKVSFY